jgi:dTDP-4-amino-4,6-dideoxygalactose transaminase
MVPFLDLTRQYKGIEDEILSSAAERIYEKGHFILGEEVSAFEKEFSHCCGVRCGVGMGSGTDALYLVSYPYSLSEGFSEIEI